jgi:hypothetical protein
MNTLSFFAYSYPLFLVLIFGFSCCDAGGYGKYYRKMTPADTLSRLATGAGFCHRVRVSFISFISAQDHARNRLLHALYAPRKRLSSTLGPRAATGMRDAGYELPRIPVLRTSVNKGKKIPVMLKESRPSMIRNLAEALEVDPRELLDE